MKHFWFGIAAALVASLTFSIAQTAFAAMAAVDEKLFSACMVLETSEMKGNAECMGFFKRMNVVTEDIEMLRTCRGMQPALLTNDKECAVLLAKHPDLVLFGSAPTVTPNGPNAARLQN